MRAAKILDPGKAGIHLSAREQAEEWVPACAGTYFLSRSYRALSRARDAKRDQLRGGAVERIEMAAGVDQRGELRVADRDAWRDVANAASLFLEIPDEFAAG